MEATVSNSDIEITKGSLCFSNYGSEFVCEFDNCNITKSGTERYYVVSLRTSGATLTFNGCSISCPNTYFMYNGSNDMTGVSFIDTDITAGAFCTSSTNGYVAVDSTLNGTALSTVSKYLVSIDAIGPGTVSFDDVNVTYAEKYCSETTTVYFRVTPDEDCVCTRVASGSVEAELINGGVGSQIYSFTMPAANVPIEVTFESTATPTIAPTATPTAAPTATPTAAPTATPTAEPTPTQTPEPSYEKGDINRDGLVDLDDAITGLKYTFNDNYLQYEPVELTNDGKFDIDDVVLLVKYIILPEYYSI